MGNKLLYFNLAIDENDTSLGFATQWIETIAKSFDQVDVVTLKKVSEIKFSENINIYGPNEQTGKFIKYLALYFKNVPLRLFQDTFSFYALINII